MNKPYPPVYYAEYLQLNKVLDAQKPKSEEYGQPAHDEMLFIIVHQVFELWFKQIIHEIDSVCKMFQDESVDERSIGVAVSRIQRIIEIQKVLTEQLRVIETMTPLDFLEFRDFLIPASGFQSYQFRLIENKLGLKSENRVQYNNIDYFNALNEEHRRQILASMENISLFEMVEKWLERTPFLKFAGFDFWEEYKNTVENMIENERQIILTNPTLSEKKKETQLQQNAKTLEHFEALYDEEKHNELEKEGVVRLSLRATLAALFINLYRDEPILHLPFRFLNALAEMDEMFATWRYRHVLMVHRMIGAKVGTGGSSGHSYLMTTIEKHRVFTDLFNLSTYLIPRSSLPELPEELTKQLGFYYSQKIKL
ncbi:MAG: tryptophan 2,3-dioxygenase [Ignavibacteriae bacterium]|nr:MAG: tryptophan 2,3-dioxygenase [Ignavibacteriota bacterium]